MHERTKGLAEIEAMDQAITLCKSSSRSVVQSCEFHQLRRISNASTAFK
jgi:hypothetical protein